MQENENKSTPRPVFMRMLMLFGFAIGCLLVGVVVSTVTGDLVLLAMSAILSIAFATKGVLLKRKISTGKIYSVSGVCVSITPKILGRYRRIELVDIDTGDDVSFILPKKVTFKIGHAYTCWFDNQIGSSPLNINNSIDLPANGFLGFEDFGVYQEKPSVAAGAADKEEPVNTENNVINEEEQS